MNDVRQELYLDGMRRVMKFLDVNSIPYPQFFTFQEAEQLPPRAKIAHSLAVHSPLVGGLTAFYREGCIVTNVPVTALPVQQPRMRSWSYPGWKTDRTCVGVLAHETGHYVEEYLRKRGVLKAAEHGPAWRELIGRVKKRVTSYEPIPSEAWAESVRLFITNPYLLKFGIPERYTFIRKVLKPSEKRTWREVLGDHPTYCSAGERWIAA